MGRLKDHTENANLILDCLSTLNNMIVAVNMKSNTLQKVKKKNY